MRGADSPRRRGGFALPFAMVVLVAFSLAVALMIDGAVAAFRSAGAELQSTRTVAEAETALARALEIRFDTLALGKSPGSVLATLSVAAPDSISTTVQLLTPPMIRIVVTVRSRESRVRVSAGRVGLANLARDSVSAGELRIIPVGPLWWVPIP